MSDAADLGSETTTAHAIDGVRDTGTIVTAVRDLVDIMRRGGIAELDVTFGDVSVRLRGGTSLAAPVAVPAVEVVASSPDPDVPGPSPDHQITSPMVGTFYASPTPGTPPYVKVGDHIEIGQTVGIIEAMKIMNEITADRAGLVTAVLVENGQAVEYGSPILRLDPSLAGLVAVVANGG